MMILALDIGQRFGWLCAPAGSICRAQSEKLRGERVEDTAVIFARWLDNLCETTKPDLIVMEHYLPSGALKGSTMTAVRDALLGQSYVIRTIAALRDIPVRAPSPQRIRSHFIGAVSGAPKRPKGYKRTPKEIREDRAATKRMVIRRAIQLGYIEANSTDDDAADAAALFDFASSYFANTPSANWALMEAV